MEGKKVNFIGRKTSITDKVTASKTLVCKHLPFIFSGKGNREVTI
jgi:hypothetical protein